MWAKKKKQPTDKQLVVSIKSEPERIRTFDRLLRREVLYPAELRAHYSIKKGDDCSSPISVGVAGFEPATSSSQTRRDDRATLHPELYYNSQQICICYKTTFVNASAKLKN